MTKTLSITEARLALDAAEVAHGDLVRAKCRAAGVAPYSADADRALAGDLDIAKSYLERCKAERDLAVAYGDHDDATMIGYTIDDARREVAKLLVRAAIGAGARDID
jgi:hypothetical protein